MRACPHCLSVYSIDVEHCSVDGEKTGGPQALKDKEVDGYVFDELLGVGGTGCVFKGHRTDDQSPCAIKLLFREMAADQSLIERFRREAEAVSRMDHPNVVKIFGYGATESGTVFIAMEFLKGKTLKEVLELEAPLKPPRAGRIAEQMASGLGEAHRLGFVHRDLKPGNIMITRDTLGREQVKLLDFGIVASLKEREADDRLTKTGYIVGTPTYMAPEQIDPKMVGPQVDVYAIGVMLYEMLCGAPPFRGSLEQILVAKMTEDPSPIEGSGELGALALQFLEKDPQARPQNALQASAELGRLSLLSADPATVRAEIPDLPNFGEDHPTYGEVGAAPPTLKVDPESWDSDATNPTNREPVDDQTARGDKWTADTRRINFESPPPVEFTRPSIADTKLSEPERPDTLIDGLPAGLHDSDHSVAPLRAHSPIILSGTTDQEDSHDIPTAVTAAPGLDRDTDEDMPVPSVGETVREGEIPPYETDEKETSAIPTMEETPASTLLDQPIPKEDVDMFDDFRNTNDESLGDEETDLQFVYDPATQPPPKVPSTAEAPPNRYGTLKLVALSVLVVSLFLIAAILAFNFMNQETVLIDVPQP